MPTTTQLGAVTGVSLDARGATLTTDSGTLEILVLAEDLIRMRAMRHGQDEPEFTYAVARTDWPSAAFEAFESEDAVTVRTASASVTVRLADGVVNVVGADVRPILADARIAWEGPKATLTW